MTKPAARARRRPPARRRRRGGRGPAVAVLSVLALAVAFAVGVAVGESLHDNPRPGGARTYVRTLEPLQVPPAARTTVTVHAP